MVADEYSGCVYLAMNATNGRAYIGKTVGRLFNRKASHKKAAEYGRKTPFMHAIRKHGWNAFDWHELFLSGDETALLAAEVQLIADYGRAGVRLYNVGPGGEGLSMPCTPERRARVSAAMKGRVISEEHRRKLSEARKGYRPSAAAVEKMRQTKVGRKLPPWTPERRAKVAATRAAKAAVGRP